MNNWSLYLIIKDIALVQVAGSYLKPPKPSMSFELAHLRRRWLESSPQRSAHLPSHPERHRMRSSSLAPHPPPPPPLSSPPIPAAPLRSSISGSDSLRSAAPRPPPLPCPPDHPPSDSDLACRFCFEGEERGQLLAPCKCTGSQRWVHSLCLARWLAHASLRLGEGPRADICRVCSSPFSLALLPSSVSTILPPSLSHSLPPSLASPCPPSLLQLASPGSSVLAEALVPGSLLISTLLSLPPRASGDLSHWLRAVYLLLPREGGELWGVNLTRELPTSTAHSSPLVQSARRAGVAVRFFDGGMRQPTSVLPVHSEVLHPSLPASPLALTAAPQPSSPKELAARHASDALPPSLSTAFPPSHPISLPTTVHTSHATSPPHLSSPSSTSSPPPSSGWPSLVDAVASICRGHGLRWGGDAGRVLLAAKARAERGARQPLPEVLLFQGAPS